MLNKMAGKPKETMGLMHRGLSILNAVHANPDSGSRLI